MYSITNTLQKRALYLVVFKAALTRLVPQLRLGNHSCHRCDVGWTIHQRIVGQKLSSTTNYTHGWLDCSHALSRSFDVLEKHLNKANLTTVSKVIYAGDLSVPHWWPEKKNMTDSHTKDNPVTAPLRLAILQARLDEWTHERDKSRERLSATQESPVRIKN